MNKLIGQKVLFFDKLDSTSTYVYEHLDQLSHGDIVLAKTQTNGRGRRNHHWVSIDGNLHFSFVYEQKFVTNDFELIAKTSLAIIDCLNSFNVQASIKYPNDIVVNQGKIAGILLEKVEAKYIVGVGINVLFHNISNYEFYPSSILLETSKIVDYKDVLSAFRTSFSQFESQRIEKWLPKYRENSIVIGKKVKTRNAVGTCVNISEKGALILEDGKVISGANEINIRGWRDEK